MQQLGLDIDPDLSADDKVAKIQEKLLKSIGDTYAIKGKWGSGMQTVVNTALINAATNVDDHCLLKWLIAFEAGSDYLKDSYRQKLAGAVLNRKNCSMRYLHHKTHKGVYLKKKTTLRQIIASSNAFSFLNRKDRSNSVNSMKMLFMLNAKKGKVTKKDFFATWKNKKTANDMCNRWKNANRALGPKGENIKNNEATHFWVDWVSKPSWHDDSKVVETVNHTNGTNTYFLKGIAYSIRVPMKDSDQTR